MNPNETNEDFQKLVDTYENLNALTSTIQDQIARAWIEHPDRRKELEVMLRKSEEEMQKRMNAAVYEFIGAMALASMNHSNLFMQAIALHSPITGDPTIGNVLDAVNQRVLEKHFN